MSVVICLGTNPLLWSLLPHMGQLGQLVGRFARV